MEHNHKEYIKANEIKVNNLLSELYQRDAEIMQEIKDRRKKHKMKVNTLEKEHKEIKKKKVDLLAKYEKLKSPHAKNRWESYKSAFELSLKWIEGDKKSFFQKAESVIESINNQIDAYEQEAKDVADEVKEDIYNKIRDIESYRDEISSRLDVVKDEHGEVWREMLHWLIDTSRSISEYLTEDKKKQTADSES